MSADLSHFADHKFKAESHQNCPRVLVDKRASVNSQRRPLPLGPFFLPPMVVVEVVSSTDRKRTREPRKEGRKEERKGVSIFGGVGGSCQRISRRQALHATDGIVFLALSQAGWLPEVLHAYSPCQEMNATTVLNPTSGFVSFYRERH